MATRKRAPGVADAFTDALAGVGAVPYVAVPPDVPDADAGFYLLNACRDDPAVQHLHEMARARVHAFPHESRRSKHTGHAPRDPHDLALSAQTKLVRRSLHHYQAEHSKG